MTTTLHHHITSKHIIGYVALAMTLLMTFACKPSYAQMDELAFRVVAHHQDGRSSTSNSVTAHRPLNLYMPTAFTPDGDGLNDRFIPVGEGIESFQMNIYDRWGNLIFNTDSPEEGWDGSVNGAMGMSGSYAYEITATSYHRGSVHRTGSVSLLVPAL